MMLDKKLTDASLEDELIVEQVKSLFEFVPPHQLRRDITDIFFYALMNKDFDLAAQQDAVEEIFMFLQFLDGMEDQRK